ncbi:MAG: site-2 protease family protein [Acholeplasma sp.]|nr:site-2 protease family protein [Acholeplasma sp.]
MKKHGFLIYLLIVLILGMISAPLFHTGFLPDLINGFFKLPFYGHIGIILLSFFLSVFLHELTHLIAFKVKGMRIKAFLVLFFVISKHNDKWQFKFNFKLLKMGGGMVMPEIKEIKEELTYYKYANAISTSLIAAPIFTIIYALLFLVLNLVFFHTLPIFTVFSFYTVLFGILFTLSSNLATDELYGDFKAFKKFNEDPLFKVSIITQYTDNLSNYHLKLLESHIEKYPVSDFPNEILPVLSTLYDYYVYEKDEWIVPLIQRAEYVFVHPFLIKRFVRKESYIPLAQYILYFLVKYGKKDKADGLYPEFKAQLDALKLNDLTKTYIDKQTRHVLNYEDHSEYLNQTDHISPSRYSFIFEGIPDFIESEHNHNKGFDVSTKIPVVPLEKE